MSPSPLAATMNQTSICLVAVANHTITKYLYCEPQQLEEPVKDEFGEMAVWCMIAFWRGLLWQMCLVILGFAVEAYTVGLERFKSRCDTEHGSGKVSAGGEWDWVMDVQRISKKTDEDHPSSTQDSIKEPTSHSAEPGPPVSAFGGLLCLIWYMYLFVAWIGGLDYSPSTDWRAWLLVCGLSAGLFGAAHLKDWFNKGRHIKFPPSPLASPAARDLESGAWELQRSEKRELYGV
ncbi:hypothetical protein LTR56_020639 [Elasticomyces elasticus]|nr:hypothetical protein LTR56_020639 [Elasticomyces elasticus]KAK3636902.1 hypothetical protein LTR22_018529 [Elasticomyces elasticus]KAK4910074.1 hypothetical protein LTR49_021199 [Elasticomyces elasticus]KAK5749941.1 hypothetical protein LTS12_020015 [Elasticomyces elasticus]